MVSSVGQVRKTLAELESRVSASLTLLTSVTPVRISCVLKAWLTQVPTRTISTTVMHALLGSSAALELLVAAHLATTALHTRLT